MHCDIIILYINANIKKRTEFIMNTENIKIILASASPRRREILAQMGADFTVITADASEDSDITSPVELTQELARRKGQAVYDMLKASGEADGKIIISADTVVAADGNILGKPRDRADAYRMLKLLCGRPHEVVTGIGVTVNGVTYTDHSRTLVYVEDIPDSEIWAYIDSGDPMDKAGAYGIQGAFSSWVRGIDGCYFGVVGLPQNKLSKLFYDCVGCYPKDIK